MIAVNDIGFAHPQKNMLRNLLMYCLEVKDGQRILRQLCRKFQTRYHGHFNVKKSKVYLVFRQELQGSGDVGVTSPLSAAQYSQWVVTIFD